MPVVITYTRKELYSKMLRRLEDAFKYDSVDLAGLHNRIFKSEVSMVGDINKCDEYRVKNPIGDGVFITSIQELFTGDEAERDSQVEDLILFKGDEAGEQCQDDIQFDIDSLNAIQY